MIYFDYIRLQEHYPEVAEECKALDAPFFMPAGSTMQEEIQEPIGSCYFRVIGYESNGTLCSRTSMLYY